MRNLTKKIRCFFIALVAAFLFVSIAPLHSIGIENTSVAQAAVKISTKKITIPKGSRYALQVTGTRAKVQWSTSNKKVATVSNGEVSGKKPGTATITAKVGTKKYTCKVTVLNIKSNATNVILTKGKTFTLKVTGSKRKPTFTSSKKTVATVNAKTGKITAKKNGTATITVKVDGKSFAVKVTVETPALNKKSLTLYNKGSYTLKLNTTRKVTWKSSNTAVAKVNSKGEVTALKSGTAVITASVNDKSYTCKVKVINTTILHCEPTMTLEVGEKKTFTITVGDAFTWNINEQNIAYDLSTWSYKTGDTITMTIEGKTVGTETLTFPCEDGTKKVITVNITGTGLDTTIINNASKLVTIEAFSLCSNTAGTLLRINLDSYIKKTISSNLVFTFTFYDKNDTEVNTLDFRIPAPTKGERNEFSDKYDATEDPELFYWIKEIDHVALTITEEP